VKTDEKEIADFIRAQTVTSAATIVPEIALHLATEVTPLWQLTEERMKGNGLPPPYWAFAWPGGQGVARYVLDHPETVKGLRVLDFAAGCGIAAIAAMKAGAKEAQAADIDPFAQTALRLNADLNGVAVSLEAIDLGKAYARADVILAGDVCYQQAMSTLVLRWLYLSVVKGVRVILADPGRAYVPETGLKELARYEVPTSRDLEDRDSRTVTLWDLGLPAEEK
jgi:predicted nicotinamide N-methyase